MTTEISLRGICEYLDDIQIKYSLQSSSDISKVILTNLAKIGECDANSITFLTATYKHNPKLSLISGLVITAQGRSGDLDSIATLEVENPRFVFAKVCQRFFPLDREDLLTIDERRLSSKRGIKIGSNARIHPSALIGNYVEIGNNVEIGAGVVLRSKTKVGNECIIGDNTVVGGEGFGFERWNQEVVRLQHYGGVDISDFVEIGSNCTLNRGTLGDTLISAHVKIDCLVHIGHNVKIGCRSIVTAGAVLCGSCNVGEDCWIAPNAVIGEGKTLGNNVFVGYSAVVNRDIESGTVVVGNPAKPFPPRGTQ
jgi:UDP-3-O-[3-hydroxymyristoyl] glucosamine N-acyltransferase